MVYPCLWRCSKVLIFHFTHTISQRHKPNANEYPADGSRVQYSLHRAIEVELAEAGISARAGMEGIGGFRKDIHEYDHDGECEDVVYGRYACPLLLFL